MPRQLKGSVYFLLVEARRTLIIFWTILFGLLFLSVILNLFIFKEGIIMFELSFPIYILAAIIGQLTVKTSIPYLIKMGSTRLNVLKSVGVYFLMFSLFNSIFSNTIHSVFGLLSDKDTFTSTPILTISSSEEQAMQFNHIADFFENVWWTRVLIDTSILFFLLAVGFMIGLIFYRFGIIGGLTFIAVMLFTLFLGLAQGWLVDFLITIFSNMTILFFGHLFLVALLLYLFSYVLFRRLSVI